MSKYDKFLVNFLKLKITEKIILVNIILFVLPLVVFVFFYLFKIPKLNIYYYFELSPNIGDIIFRPWSLITYGFIHASVGHLFWNMILFYLFSTLFLNLFKEDDLAVLFCLGIIVGGLLFVFSYSSSINFYKRSILVNVYSINPPNIIIINPLTVHHTILKSSNSK